MRLTFTLVLLCTYYIVFSQTCPTNSSIPKVLIAGDSWAQYMSDDGTHNKILDKFGHADKDLLGPSLGSNPGSGYTGTEYAISGSEAKEWADKANYPWIQNVIDEITNNPTIETVILSIGGNDILAGRSGGGWYQNMDNDNPGSEAALFNTIRDNTFVIIDDILAAHPDVEILISSYDYPNFNASLCFLFACPMRRDLSYSGSSPLITDAELNQMMITVESIRIPWADTDSRLHYDNAVGLSQYYYGDGTNAPGTLPLPEQKPPFTANFYGGNSAAPTLRSNFRIGPDPIHLDRDAYEYKIIHQTMNYFMPKYREDVTATVFSSGGSQDGWTTGNTSGTNEVRVGDVSATESYKGILNFDTESIPDNAIINSVSLYMIRKGASNANPFTSGALGAAQIDVKNGTFGTADIENADFAAPADATDAGCFHGTVSQNDFAVRIDLDAAGLAALNKTGNTQFRISFPDQNDNPDYIDFNTGDDLVDATLSTVGLAEYMADARPFLDINYTMGLPVELFSFDAMEQDGDVQLNWQSAMEDNFYGYEVQHSLDGERWNKIDFAEGIGAGRYQTYHFNPSAGNNYYRLKMIDNDETFEYSEIRTVRIEKGVSSYTIYPNPFLNEITIQASKAKDADVIIFDALGRTIHQQQIFGTDGNEGIYTIPLNEELAHGIYTIHIVEAGGKSNTFRISKI